VRGRTNGLPLGAYAERRPGDGAWLDGVYERLVRGAERRLSQRRSEWIRVVGYVACASKQAAGESDARLGELARYLGARLRVAGLERELVYRSFGLVREMSRRVLGWWHSDEQVFGGWLALNGMVAEMEPGEGKSLAATLPACTAALAGYPVHSITLEDHFAKRDCDDLAPLYRALGLSVAQVLQGMTHSARRAAYRADVVYCASRQVALDYLRDRALLGRDAGRVRLQLERLHSPQPRLGRLLLRGLVYGIVDEADAILVDEASKPLVIADQVGAAEEERVYRQAGSLAAQLERDRDYVLDVRARTVELTPSGSRHLAELARPLNGVWKSGARREELLRIALTAAHLLERDRHYVIENLAVVPRTGPDGESGSSPTWSRGLRQAIEIKEGLDPSTRTEPLARLSYQSFFGRYVRLGGFSSTVREVAGELAATYGVPVVRVAPRRERRRLRFPDRVLATAVDRCRAVVERVQSLHAEGRPVLVCADTEKTATAILHLLRQAGIQPAQVDPRRPGEASAVLLACAEPGRVTVAPSSAVRCPSMEALEGSTEGGGLHVIAAGRNASRRVDRLLFELCARPGGAGSFEAILSREDELFSCLGSRAFVQPTLALAARLDGKPASWSIRLLVALAQRSIARQGRRMRQDLRRLDEHRATLLAFSGTSD
jgi:preprotein translocase subunit SecA